MVYVILIFKITKNIYKNQVKQIKRKEPMGRCDHSMSDIDENKALEQTFDVLLHKKLATQARELEESRNTARRYRAQVTRLRAGLEMIMAQSTTTTTTNDDDDDDADNNSNKNGIGSDKATEALKLLQKETERHAMDLERETKRQSLQIAALEHKVSNQTQINERKTPQPHNIIPQPHTLDKSTQCDLGVTQTALTSGAYDGSASRFSDPDGRRRLEMVFQIQHTRETRLLACRVMELEDELEHVYCHQQQHEYDKRQAELRQGVAERTLRQRESEHIRVREGLEGEIGQLKVKINSLEGEVVLVCQRQAMWMNSLGCKA
ncbi:hypothetical protein F4703DRAFT_1864534 [Phycomyces blakesleeanus]